MPLKERLFKALHEKNALQRFVIRRFLFDAFQIVGVHLTGDHFYEIVPNTRFVRQHYSESPRALPGIQWDLAGYELHALKLLEGYGHEYLQTRQRFGYEEANPYFSGLDALMLYLTLRDLKPDKFVEVGQGYSTRIALAALERNAQDTGLRPKFVSIDPYPRFRPENFPAVIELELVQQEVQTLEIAPILEGCRFLFVDSSHVYKYGSDVEFELRQVYPLLPHGTLIHIHDIFTPYEYPKKWLVEEKRFWNEQYLLECFLMFNQAFEMVLPVHLLARQSTRLPERIQDLHLERDFRCTGSSFYMRRCNPAAT